MPRRTTGGVGYYAVRAGRRPGIYKTWSECEEQVRSFPKAKFKRFDTEWQASEFIGSAAQPPAVAQPQNNAPINYSAAVGQPVYPQMMYMPLANMAAGVPPGLPPSAVPPPPPPIILGDEPTFQSMRTLTATIVSTLSEVSRKLHSVVEMSNGLKAWADMTGQQTVMSNVNRLCVNLERAKKSQQDIQDRMMATDLIFTDIVMTNKRDNGDNGGGSNRKRARNDTTASTSSGDPRKVTVYTDGCCLNNGRGNPQAGYGVYWGPGDPRNISERLQGRQTNNRAEINAARRAVEEAQRGGYTHIEIMTDSRFLINCITKWIHKWKENGWKVANGKPVLNKDDLIALETAMHGVHVTWTHVRAHIGIPGNEMADKLANEGAKKPYLFNDTEEYDYT